MLTSSPRRAERLANRSVRVAGRLIRCRSHGGRRARRTRSAPEDVLFGTHPQRTERQGEERRVRHPAFRGANAPRYDQHRCGAVRRGMLMKRQELLGSEAVIGLPACSICGQGRPAAPTPVTRRRRADIRSGVLLAGQFLVREVSRIARPLDVRSTNFKDMCIPRPEAGDGMRAARGRVEAAGSPS